MPLAQYDHYRSTGICHLFNCSLRLESAISSKLGHGCLRRWWGAGGGGGEEIRILCKLVS